MTADKTILVVEDDAAIRRGLRDALRHAGFSTLEAGDGYDGRGMALEYEYDLLLLDLVLPGPDGLAILEEVRAARPAIPVIILTARGMESERVRGLSLGADDYVVKPFGVAELLARIEAVLRRSAERPTARSRVRFPQVMVDFERREVTSEAGEVTELTERENELLGYLTRHAGRAIAREEVLERVWRVGSTSRETRMVDMAVARLRLKLGDDPSHPRTLVTVRGKGYKVALPEDAR